MRRIPATTPATRPASETDVWKIDLAGLYPEAYGGYKYAFDAVHVPSLFIATTPLRAKSDATDAILVLKADARSGGAAVTNLRADCGGESTGASLTTLLGAARGVSPTFIPPDRHLPYAEQAHRDLDTTMRANLALARPHAPGRLWPYARCCAAAQVNLRPHPTHYRPRCSVLHGAPPNLRVPLPFGSQIAAYDTSPASRLSPRATVGTYLGPAPAVGSTNITYTVDNQHPRRRRLPVPRPAWRPPRRRQPPAPTTRRRSSTALPRRLPPRVRPCPR